MRDSVALLDGVSRRFRKNVMFFYPNDYPEDYDLAFRFYEVGLKPISCNTILHHWRDYATRTSRTHKHYADHTFFRY